MPVTIPGIVGALVPNMAATGQLGSKMPDLAVGIANGLVKWLPSITVITVDAGSLGVGSGGPMPLIVAQPLLYLNLMAGDAAFGFFGPMSPLLTLGVANGLVLAFAQALIKTTHPGIGAGSGVATFRAPNSIPLMIEGFAAAGLKGDGPTKKASAIGTGLDATFASLVVPIPIVGSASPAGGAGAGFGQII